MSLSRSARVASGRYSAGALLSHLVLLLVLHASAGYAQQSGAVPIREALRDVDGDRIPDRMGETVELVGTAISDPLVIGPTGSLINLQDSTGGVMLFAHDTTQLKTLAAGDRVRVLGTVGQYRGAEQLIIGRVERIGTAEMPAPRDVLAADLVVERYAGQLVRVSGELVASEGNDGRITAELRDRSGRIPVLISQRFLSDPEFTRRLLRGGEVEIVGIASQSDATPPFDSGYRLIPRGQEDFSLPFLPPYRRIAIAVLLGAVLILWLLRRRSQSRAAEMERLACELQHSNQALQESEARNRTMLQAVPDLVFRYTREGEVVDIHVPDQEELYAVPSVGQNIRDLFPPEAAESILTYGEQALDSGSLQVVEFSLPLSQGLQEFETRLATSGSEELLAVVRNVTAQREAEERERQLLAEHVARTEAEAAETRIRNILESISDGFVALDRTWRFVYVNTQAANLFGKPAEQLLGRNVWEIFPQLVGSRFQEEYERAMAEGIPAHFEAQSTVSGDWLQVHAYPGSDLLSVYYRDITTQKEAEDRLRESEQRFRALTENSLDTVTILAADGTIRYMSASVVRELGWTSEEIQGRSIFDFIHPDDQPGVLAQLQRLIEGEPQSMDTIELRFRHKDGSWRVLESLVQNHLDEPAVDGLVANSRDITERKAAEEALRTSEERFRLMVESVKDYAIILLDPDGRIVEWNPGAERVKGYAEQEILGEHFSLFYPEEDQARGKPRRMLEIAGREGHYEDEDWRVRKDGSHFWASVVITALRNEVGTLVGFAKITRDLTERREREARLQRQGEMVQLLQHVAVAANEAASVEEALRDTIEYVCAQAGFTAGHAYARAGDGSGELVPTGLWCLEDDERLAVFRRATESGRLPRGVGLPGRVLISGRTEWMSDVTEDGHFLRKEAASHAGLRAGIAFPVLAGEEIVAVLEFFSKDEISPDSFLLDAMANIGTQLGRVFERKQAEADVFRAKEEAERANLAKSEFLSRMSHELRTPMNAILGFAQLMEMEAHTEDDRESVEQILRAGRHLLALIDEVLDIARIEAGRMTLSLEPVGIGGVLQETQDMVRQMAAEHRVRLRVESCERHVQADQQRLKQVLLNLLSNAIKYNREGGSVTITCEERPQSRLRIAVADTGRGIAPEKLQRLFTPFDRLDAELEGMADGTGLGLSLSKGLVEAMGGTLGVQSIAGEGSTFWLDLPLAAAPMHEEESVDDASEAGAAETREVESTVLLIEDNLSNVRLIERVLTQRPGIRLLAAMQGRLGLELAEQHRPDLILLDVHLPDLRGDQVLEQLRRAAPLRDVPVVVISADATERQTRRLLDAGARDYLSKPLDVRRLLDVLDEALASKESVG